MPRIIGTRHDDTFDVSGEPGEYLIRGRLGNDEITGWDDRLYGDAGNDTVWDQGPHGQAFGGRGNDSVSANQAWGGVGDDHVSGFTTIFDQTYRGLAVGGSGNDFVYGSGDLYGDEGPGVAQKIAGNDALRTDLTSLPDTTMTGGHGHDVFQVSSDPGLYFAAATVTDFRHGEDAISTDAWKWNAAGELEHATGAQLAAALDANHDGVLNWADSVGADGDWSTPDGGAVYTDGANLLLGLNATFAGTTGTDATHWVVVANTTELTVSGDWLV